MLFLVIILQYKPFPLFVSWSVKIVFSHILAEREISSSSASENKKLIIRLWVHDRRTKVTMTGRFIRVLFPVEVTGYICVLEWILYIKIRDILFPSLYTWKNSIAYQQFPLH